MKLSKTHKIGFDTETTGTDVRRDRIVTAALIQVDPDGKIITKQDWIINPGIEVPEGASAIHGVTTERAVNEGVQPSEGLAGIVWGLFEAMSWGLPIVAFNLAFDWSILYHELKRYHMDELRFNLFESEYQRLVDPLVLDKHCDKYRKGERKLGVMCEKYGVELDNWHDASADAHAALLLVNKIVQKYWYLDSMAPGELYQRQVLWHKEQIIGLQQYHEEQQGFKMAEDYDYHWPLMK